jgi:hypothetical protein
VNRRSGIQYQARNGTHQQTQPATMPAEERVLCFERQLFTELGEFQGLSLEVAKYLPVVTAMPNLRYLNRTDAEQDKRYKQLIPYVLILCNGRILRYRRGKKGQETRLHGFYSVGIGGHISEEDHGLFSNDRGYQDGMRRELMEEVAIGEEKDVAVAARTWVTCILASCMCSWWRMNPLPPDAAALPSLNLYRSMRR